jgi:hypothetical protein
MRHYELFEIGDVNNTDLCYLDSFVESIHVKSWKLLEGERIAEDWPPDARIELQPENPGLTLSSFLGSKSCGFVASKELREVIERHCAGVEIEYLSFTILDHRRRVLSTDYCVVNPIGTFDCLDLQASDIDWFDKKPDTILGFNERVLDRTRAMAAPQLFRPHRDESTYILGPALVEEIRQRGFTNLLLTPLRYSDEPQPAP